MEIPYPQLQLLLPLVGEAYDGRVVLPEFQRSFVWANRDIEDLLTSIMNGYFVGSLLFLRRRDQFDFKIRYFEGVNKVNPQLPADPDERNVEKAVLDGQQRLTAIFYALHCPPELSPRIASYPYRYFVSVHEKLSGKDWEDVVWSISENDRTRNIEVDLGSGTRKYSFKEMIDQAHSYSQLLEIEGYQKYCYQNGIIPLRFLRSDGEFNTWLDNYTQYYIQSGEQFPQVAPRKESIRKLFANWFNFSVPTLTLENRPFYEVAEIFERINKSGVELSVFALATAVFFKQGVNIRDWWKEFYSRGQEIQRFCDDDDEEFPKYVLQLMALLQGKEVKKKVLINPRELTIEKAKWDRACLLLDAALSRVQNTFSGYGVIRPTLLPYKPILVCLAGLLDSCAQQEEFGKLDAWYWSSVFTGRYAGASDTAIKQDFDQVRAWFKDSSKQPIVALQAETGIDALNLKSVAKGALPKALMNLIALEGAKDFFTGQSIELSMLEDHHIFPKKSGIALTNENSILNRTLISDDTNGKILNKKPSIYVKEIETKAGSEQRAKEILNSHLIDEKAYALLAADDYEGFLNAREEFLKNLMKSRIQPTKAPSTMTAVVLQK